MIKFMRNHWILMLSLLLLLLMSGPLLYFENLLRSSVQRKVFPEYFPLQHPPEIGICLNDLMESRWMTERSVWNTEASRAGVALQIRVAHHSLPRQIQQIRSLLRQRIRILIVVPVARHGLNGVLREAAGQGVKIVFYDELTEGPADYYFGLDYYQAGQVQAGAVYRKAGAGRYLVLRGPTGSFKAERLAQGQREGLQRLAKYQVQVVAAALDETWGNQSALKTRALMTHPQLGAILAPNDLIAAAIDQMWEKQKTAPVFLAGLGMEYGFEQRIRITRHLLTLQPDYTMLARDTFAAALRMLKGQRITVNATVKGDSGSIAAWLVRHFTVLQGEGKI